MFAWFQSWRRRQALRKLARQMGSLLKQRYGFQEYYTPGQVLKTAESIGLEQDAQAYAIAIYVQPADGIKILTAMKNAPWAESLRAWMAGECFGLSGGYNLGFQENVFMHHPHVAGHLPSGGLFGDSDSSGHHGGGDGGGHAGGDSGSSGH